MARPKRKTEVTTLKMTPEVRLLWERCATAEVRTLTNMFEVMVRAYARQADITAEASPDVASVPAPGADPDATGPATLPKPRET